MKISDSDDLSSKLQTWTVEAAVPDSFQREVWKRVTAQQLARENAFWPRFRAWLVMRATRPKYALALLFLTLSVSIGAAHLQARSDNTKHAKILQERYAASIDPLAAGR